MIKFQYSYGMGKIGERMSPLLMGLLASIGGSVSDTAVTLQVSAAESDGTRMQNAGDVPHRLQIAHPHVEIGQHFDVSVAGT